MWGVTCSSNRWHVENLCPRLPHIWRKTKKLFSTGSSTCRLVAGRTCHGSHDKTPISVTALWTAAQLPRHWGGTVGADWDLE